MTQVDQSNRMDKIKKLMAKADGASTDHEADAFLAKAQDLMTQWGINDAMLQASGDLEKTNEKIITEFYPISKSTYFQPTVLLWQGIAEVNNVKLLLQDIERHRNRQGIYLVGWESDIKRVEFLFDIIFQQAKRQRVRMVQQKRRDFMIGYVIRITQRLIDQHERTKHEVQQEQGGNFLPVLVDRREAVEREAGFLMDPNKNAKKWNTKYDRYAYEAGHVAANAADLGNERISDDRMKQLT